MYLPRYLERKNSPQCVIIIIIYIVSLRLPGVHFGEFIFKNNQKWFQNKVPGSCILELEVSRMKISLVLTTQRANSHHYTHRGIWLTAPARQTDNQETRFDWTTVD